VLDVPGGHGKVPIGPAISATIPTALTVRDAFGEPPLPLDLSSQEEGPYSRQRLVADRAFVLDDQLDCRVPPSRSVSVTGTRWPLVSRTRIPQHIGDSRAASA
jgi:hypothetical protein